MGAWDVGIFDDDFASDLRNIYLDLVEDGNSGPEATKRILSARKEELSDPELFPVVWLVLAAVQLESNMLETRVMKKALDIIDNGRDLARWKTDNELLEKRKVVLTELRENLENYQPTSSKKKVRLQKKKIFIGDIFNIPLTDGRKCYGQYVHEHDLGMIIRVFDYFTSNDDEPDVTKLIKSKLLFPPVNVVLIVAIEDSIWEIIGNAPVKKFTFPKFLWSLSGKTRDEVRSWSIYDGKNRKFLGPKLSKKYWGLELLHSWAPSDLAKRIETGENPREKLYR